MGVIGIVRDVRVSVLSVTAGGVHGARDDDPHHPVLGLLPDAGRHSRLPVVGVVPVLLALQLRGPHAVRLRQRPGGHALLAALLSLQESGKVPQGNWAPHLLSAVVYICLLSLVG